MLHKSQTLLALTALSFVGSAHSAIIYSNETFAAGTPNYSINGLNTGTDSNSWDRLESSPGVDIFPVDALAGTDYDPQSTSRNGVVANGEPTNITPGGTIPSGQHGFVAATTNRSFTSNYSMTLATDNATSLNISLAYMFYALSTDGNPVSAKGSAIVSYSALGDFTDSVQLVSFGFGQAGSTVVTPDFGAVENTWGSFSASFTEAGAGISFTDTAKIRINRAAMVGLVSPDTNLNHITFLDDIVVSAEAGAGPGPGAVPEPSAFAFLAASLAGLTLLRRRNG